jgi:hypothetical protein
MEQLKLDLPFNHLHGFEYAFPIAECTVGHGQCRFILFDHPAVNADPFHKNKNAMKTWHHERY